VTFAQIGEVEQLILEIKKNRECTAELIDHIGAALIWLLNYTEQHDIPLDEAMGFHIKRIQSLLHELAYPLTTVLANRIVTALDANRRSDVTQCCAHKFRSKGDYERMWGHHKES
jgi:hypothetical protein